jgi:membrane protease YdiL (CAAX protease family)
MLRSLFIGPLGVRAGWRFLGFMALLMGIAAVIELALRPFMPREVGWSAKWFLVGKALTFAVAAAVTAIVARIEKRPPAAYGIPVRQAFGGAFWVGTLWGMVAVTALIAMIAVLGGLRITGIDPGMAFGTSMLWLLAMVFVGLVEEIAFRGYPLWALARGMGFWPAAILLSLGFGALHFFGKPYENLTDFTSVTLIGLFFCFTLRRTGNLWWAIGFHFAFDFAALVLFAAPNSGNDGNSLPGHILNVAYTGPAWLTGGKLGIEASLLVFVVIAVLYVAFARAYPDTRWPFADDRPRAVPSATEPEPALS